MSLEFQSKTLQNGLTIIGEHNANAQSFAAGYFVNTGSRDESAEISGVSHFLEHMAFKGTRNRSAEDINREFDEIGANNNAYTNEERTVYYGSVVAERGPNLLDLLTDMMRPTLNQDDFDMEKNVILEEIAMYDDRPSFKVFDLANEAFFNRHPLGNSVLGTVESISALSREQMQMYFENRYAPNNMTLALTGNYDWSAVTKQIEMLTRTWTAQESPRTNPKLEPRQGSEISEDKRLKRAHTAFYAPGLSAQDDNRYAAFLIANCIGDSSGSRLYWSLLDKGLVDSVYFSHDSSDGAGNYVGYASSSPESLSGVKDIFVNELMKVQNEGLTKEEWERAQRKLATSLTLRAETPYGRLMALGPNYLYNQNYQSPKELIDTIFSVSLSDGHNVLEMKPFSSLFSYTLSPSS